MRVRAYAVVVQVQAVLDDGDTLTPVAIEPMHLTVEQFARFDIDAQLHALERQIRGDAASRIE